MHTSKICHNIIHTRTPMLHEKPNRYSETWRVKSLGYSRPLRQFWGESQSSLSYYQVSTRIKKANSLCMPFLYRLTFRSNTVYLSFGSISSSVGISFFQRSSCFVERPFLASAVSRVEITLSTARRRARCRAFW